LTRSGIGAEKPAIVREHLGGHAIAAHRRHKRLAHRPAGRDCYHRGQDREPGVIVDPGDQLGFASIGQRTRPAGFTGIVRKT
jgi:hypothetical protein